MFMRFVMSLFALLLAALPMNGPAAASPEGKRVAVFATSNTNPYIGAWTGTFTKFATAAGMKVTNFSANYDAAVQAQQLDDAVGQKFDLIVICYVNDQAIVPALTRAKAANIPVILFATPIKKDYENLVTSYIGTENADLGRLAGEIMVKGNAAAGNDAFLDCRTGRMQRVFDPCFLFLHFGLGRRAYLDHRNTTGELGHALLQFFLVVVRSCFVYLHANVLDA